MLCPYLVTQGWIIERVKLVGDVFANEVPEHLVQKRLWLQEVSQTLSRPAQELAVFLSSNRDLYIHVHVADKCKWFILVYFFSLLVHKVTKCLNNKLETHYLKPLTPVHLSRPEFWRVDEGIGVNIMQEMATVWYLHPVKCINLVREFKNNTHRRARMQVQALIDVKHLLSFKKNAEALVNRGLILCCIDLALL